MHHFCNHLSQLDTERNQKNINSCHLQVTLRIIYA